MGAYTVLGDHGPVVVDVAESDGRLLVHPSAIEAAIGWRVEPQGLCRGDVCVPYAAGRPASIGEDQIDLHDVADVLRRPVLVDGDVCGGRRRERDGPPRGAARPAATRARAG